MNNQGMFIGMDSQINLVINSDAKVIKKILKQAKAAIATDIEDINTKIKELNKLKETEGNSEDDNKGIQEKIDEQLKKKEEIISEFSKKDNHINEIIDIALLQYGLLTGEDLTRFVKRSVKLIE